MEEVILALGNDMEGEATCYYIMQEILEGRSLRVSRIGFGLPSGGGLTYADETTLRSANGRSADHEVGNLFFHPRFFKVAKESLPVGHTEIVIAPSLIQGRPKE